MNGWIFPYRPWTGKTETVSTNLRLVVVPSFGLVPSRGVGSVAAVGQRRGDTEWEPAAEVVSVVKHAASHVGKSAWHAWRGVMMGAVMVRYPVVQAVEKSLGVRAMAARTPNRHWWSGREYQGDRANPGQGTRQITPVPSV